ncbi:MAG: alkaline phosphatase [Spirochaetales bacterium]|uniref:Alkaline phosphatase n=1 Tax=Candidatus Thalassospirochaeta sargassi TaxID=3119039 RepID=A0AAJ1IJN9_9SPIO|nr:alkaline phosphatase [Spirochaetales bacterium]
MKKLLTILFILVIPMAAFAGGQQEVTASDDAAEKIANAKYVLLFIGDGMAMPQINAAEAYLNSKAGTSPGVKKLSFTQMPAQGLTTTYSSNSFITDSAAAGTAIACGQKTESGVISMDATKTKVLPTIAEMAKAAGMRVGIVSSVDVDHATPAVFYSHNQSRNNYYEIGLDMADSDFDYFGGGLIKISKTPEGEKTAIEVMKDNGWTIATTREELNALQPGQQAYAYYDTSFTTNSLDYAMDQNDEDISLAEYTKKGIELLDNEKGFFMMVEGGKIDWACHANDAAASIHNTIAFDKAVEEGIKFYNAHPNETIVIVTGDHETGGLTLGFAGTKYDSAFTEIDNQKMSYEAFDKYVLAPYKESSEGRGKLSELMPEIEEAFGLTELTDYEMEMLEGAFARSIGNETERASETQEYLLYGGYEPLTVTITHILNQRAGLAWTSYSHTGVPVQTFALGIGQEMFNGYYDNTDIFKYMKTIMFAEEKLAMAQ